MNIQNLAPFLANMVQRVQIGSIVTRHNLLKQLNIPLIYCKKTHFQNKYCVFKLGNLFLFQGGKKHRF